MVLNGKRIAILIATGYNEHELLFPYYRLKEAGAEVIVGGPERGGTCYGEGRHGTDGLPFPVDTSVSDLRAKDLDALYLPGGIYSALELREREDVCQLVREAVAQAKIVGAICHGPWILASAAVVNGRRVACSRDIGIDMQNAGAIYMKEGTGTVRDGPLVTSEFFGHLPSFMREFLAAVLDDVFSASLEGPGWSDG